MSYLIDTNVISELRKGPRCDALVSQWYGDLADDEIYLSVLTIGELRKGIESIKRRDKAGARALERWLSRIVAEHEERILPIDQAVAEEWGGMNVPDPMPVIDGLLAATAKVHGLTLATRNVNDIERSGVEFINPFDSP